MSFQFRPAKRENVPLLIGVAGGTGSGKTFSALLLARGIAGGQPFAFVDTENGRGLHYADAFPEMQHGDLRAPFRPDAYVQAILAGHAHLANVPKHQRVVVVDSFSHEWTGDGGCLDWVDEITGGDAKKKAVAWATVKPAHRKMMTKLLALDAHVIVCLRAEYGKVDIVRKDGKTEFVPKKTLPGGSLNDWYPESEKAFPYELTASFLVVADEPGVPRPLKLQEQHRALVPLDKPLDENVGKALADWAAGGETTTAAAAVKSDPTLEQLTVELLGLAEQLGAGEAVEQSIGKARETRTEEQMRNWLRRQIATARENVEQRAAEQNAASSQGSFADMVPASARSAMGDQG